MTFNIFYLCIILTSPSTSRTNFLFMFPIIRSRSSGSLRFFEFFMFTIGRPRFFPFFPLFYVYNGAAPIFPVFPPPPYYSLIWNKGGG